MATAVSANSKPTDKPNKKNPITAWFKKLQNIKAPSNKSSQKKGRNGSPSHNQRKHPSPPRPKQNGNMNASTAAMTPSDPSPGAPSNDQSFQLQDTPHTAGTSFTSLPVDGEVSSTSGGGGGHHNVVDPSNRSAAPTLGTNPDTVNSDAGQSKNTTAGGAMSSHSGGANSVFSSSNHSSRSLTTTLTTIQSTAPSAHQLNHPNASANTPTHLNHSHHAQTPSQGSIYFQHQYPTTPVASAVPTHLQPQASGPQPHTYRTATANNLLTDNASVLTLASSSHNLRSRNSMDTDASIRALAPASQWGGSRESLPLSTISSSTEAQPPGTIPPGTPAGQTSSAAASAPSASAHHTPSRPSITTFASDGRTSVYSSQGVTAPALSSERNSIYAGRSGRGDRDPDTSSLRAGDASSVRALKDDGGNVSVKEKGADAGSLRSGRAGGGGGGGDAGSVRSGPGIGHGRNDSLAGSIGVASLGKDGE